MPIQPGSLLTMSNVAKVFLLRTQRCIQQKQYDSASHFLACFSLNWNVDSSLGNYYMILNDITPHLMTTSELCMFSMGSLT